MINPKRIQVYHKCHIGEKEMGWTPPHREAIENGFDTLEEARAYMDACPSTVEFRVWVEHKVERRTQTTVVSEIGGAK